MQDVMGHVYILKSSRTIGSTAARGRATFYVGWAEDLERRIHEHRVGRGAKLTAAFVQAGATLELVYSAPGTRADERKIKNYKNTRKWLERWQEQQAKRAFEDEQYGEHILGTATSINIELNERFRRRVWSLNVRTRSGRTVRAELDSPQYLHTAGIDITEFNGLGVHHLPDQLGVTIYPHQSPLGAGIGIEYKATNLRQIDTSLGANLKKHDLMCLNGERWLFERVIRPEAKGHALVSIARFNGSFYDFDDRAEITIALSDQFMVERLPYAATQSGRGWAVRKGGR